MWHCSVNQSNHKGSGCPIKFQQGPNMTEEFNFREAVPGSPILTFASRLSEQICEC
jgi:hypothetical protein